MYGELLDDGGIWERSFILPEHKEAMKRQSREATRKTRPILDGQELEQIQQVLSESFHEHRRITLRIFDEYDNVEISGIVTTIQTYRREIKLSTALNDWQWIGMSDILSAE
ncbi:YolD-like family protein [Paenibacillus motobuensis]|uniref:YolD-like family protein n=1 Tax=Paenibacillus TaxID=44249 RepID=UPI00203ECCD8|nr:MULTISPECIES: YolD-like family protein [Paenibacillus]MCM3038153.1 YolD-like family protein [Paenibacillus lutimineralis]MCM3645257.1 YolD-like family protein [Paenibacillus motobuensis]